MRRLSIMNNNSSSIASDIDAIIARAMQEYRSVREQVTNPFDETLPEPQSQEVVEEVPEEIPVNSGSILVSEETSRFSGAIWFDNIQTKIITIAGLGGIGSYVAFLLARLHPDHLYLYDDDTVEAGNMSGQLYAAQDVGTHKVNGTIRICSDFARYYDCVGFCERYTEESVATKIMICGFDNMNARRIFYCKWKELVINSTEDDKKESLFIDGRLAAESFQVLCIKGDDARAMAKYESEFLFSDAEAEETVCSYKQTTFMANMIGSVMVNLFVNFCANECNPLVPRDLPFFTEYSADTMYFKVVA